MQGHVAAVEDDRAHGEIVDYSRLNEGARLYGHHHLNVTDVDAHLAFFADALGGLAAPRQPGRDEVVSFPNGLILLRPQVPSGGTKGTTVNHFAFGVPDIRRMVDRVKGAGWPMVTRGELPAVQSVNDDLAYMADQQTDIAFVMAPDATKVEFIEVRQQTVPVALHHIHFSTPEVAETKAWYVRVLDAAPGKRGNFEAADLPGVNLTFSPASSPVAGTRGRALDHIGFEVRDLLATCRRIEAFGIKVDRAGDGSAPEGVASAFVTDPWGTLIELTEGLRTWSG